MEYNTQIQNPNAANGGEGNETNINIRDIVFMVLNNWYWFVISAVVCLGIAGLVYKMQAKSYTATGTILVRDNGNSIRYQSRNMDAILNNMDISNSGQSLENEIYMLRSSSLMSQVIRRLNMNYYCERNDLFKKITYYNDAPVQLTVHDLNEEREPKLALKIRLLANNKFSYSASDYGVEGEAYYSQPVKLDDTVSFTIEKTSFYTDAFEGVKLNVGIKEVYPMARNMIKSLSVSRVDKMASILSISYVDKNEKRSGDIVDTLIAVYNDDAIEDKNKVAQKTETFISDRISLISGELDVVDAQVEAIKRSSQLPELQGAASQLMQTGTRYGDEVSRLETELTLIRYIKNVLSDPTNKEDLLPANVGINDAGIQSMIASYNRLVNEYQRTKTTAGTSNPQIRNLVQQMDAQWSAHRHCHLLHVCLDARHHHHERDARSVHQILAVEAVVCHPCLLPLHHPFQESEKHP